MAILLDTGADAVPRSSLIRLGQSIANFNLDQFRFTMNHRTAFEEGKRLDMSPEGYLDNFLRNGCFGWCDLEYAEKWCRAAKENPTHFEGREIVVQIYPDEGEVYRLSEIPDLDEVSLVSFGGYAFFEMELATRWWKKSDGNVKLITY